MPAAVWWQDFRKKYIFMANHVIWQFALEFCRRYKIPEEDIVYYRRSDLFNLVKGIKVRNIRERKQCHITLYNEKPNRMSYIYGSEAEDFIKPYLNVKISADSGEIKGLVVSKGRWKGRVKLLFSPKDIHKMEKGDVLVSPMTSPDYVRAMRLAGAIVTDEGGMTCHAAIVSRELGIPCIVATRIATKVLKDGDLVEVDTDKGVVRKVK